jgi:predicted dienelactone hydrolase
VKLGLVVKNVQYKLSMKKHSHSITSRYCHVDWLAGVTVLCVAFISPSNAIAREPETPVATLLADAPEALKVDAARFTEQSFNWFDSQRQRIVPAKLYMPAIKVATGSVPLVIFSHGIGGSRDGYSYLGHYLAANGYGSLHVQHVGSDRQLWLGNPLALPVRLGNAAQSSEAIDRVLDLRFALDEILGGNQGALFDKARIAAAGHSYGANTTMLIAGAQVELDGQKLTLRDPRINAAILISAPPFYRMGDASKILSGVDVPTLHITATDDVIQIPGYISGIQDRIEIFKAMGNGIATPKVLAVFKDGSHSIFTDRIGTGGLYLNPRVKIATRQLALGFLNGLPTSNYGAMDAWSLRNADLVARFEKLLP